jgi:parallel beta-helix repeat protein
MPRASHAVAVTLKSVARVDKNYFQLTGNGVHCVDSDLSCSQNLVSGCSRKFSTVLSGSTLGLSSGVTVRQKSRVALSGNHLSRCDVGVYVCDGATPVVKENTIRCRF